MASLGINSGQIHLWFAFPEEIRNETLLLRYWDFLTDEEQRQKGRFHFDRDQHRYLVTRALVRSILSRYVAIQPRDWVFIANAYGRPEIGHPDKHVRSINFNISHTNSLIMLGVTYNRSLGVDVENYCTRKAPTDIADRFFAPDEVADLRALHGTRQYERFFEYWTLKESYIKARGVGLSIPLSQFSFRLSSGSAGLSLSMQPELNDHPSRWRFWQFRPAACYLAALCVEETDATPRVIATKVVPLVGEETLYWDRMRSS